MNKRILVLEDDPGFLECVTLLLQHEGYTVIPFQQMTAPEDMLAENPDCIILDEILPGICGHTICMILKRVAIHRRNIPVILMSGLPDLPERAALGGADHFVQKPFRSNDEFIRLLGNTLQAS